MENNVVNLVTDETVKEILANLMISMQRRKLRSMGNWLWLWWRLPDTELLLGTFENPDDAVQVCCNTWADIKAEADGAEEFIKTSDMLSIEVETVDWREEGTMNVGTIFAKSVCVFRRGHSRFHLKTINCGRRQIKRYLVS